MPEPAPCTDADPCPPLLPAGPIVRAEEIGVWREARQALLAARAFAARLRRRAREERAAELQRGHAEGMEQAAREVAARLLGLQAEADAQAARLQDEIPGLALDAVRSILGEMEPDERTRRAVGHALARFGPGEAATIKVAPDAIAAVRQAIRDLEAAGHTLPHLAIEADAARRPGRCTLLTRHGMVELGLDDQLGALATAFRPGMNDDAA